MNNKKQGIAYEFLKGNGTSNFNLVFVHGSDCNKKFLRPLAEKLDNYNCYLIDLPGHGDSDDTGYSSENYLNAIKDFVSDIDNVILIGHSLGACLVVGVGTLNLPTVKAIVSLNGAAEFSGLNQEIAESVNNNIFDLEKMASFIGHMDDPIMMQSLPALESAEIGLIDFKIDLEIDFSKDLDKINVPALIIGGASDILVFPEKSEYLNDKIKNSKLVIIPDTMHALPLVRRDEVSKLINEFLNNL